jgi:hypothetical protein
MTQYVKFNANLTINCWVGIILKLPDLSFNN